MEVFAYMLAAFYLSVIGILVGFLGGIFLKARTLIITWLVIVTLIALLSAITEVFPSEFSSPSIYNAVSILVIFEIYDNVGLLVGLGLIRLVKWIFHSKKSP